MSTVNEFKVLIVEDEPHIARGLQENLEMEGYKVLAASDGQTGLQLALAEDPDLVILDLMIPKMNGFDVCRRLHEERIRGSILILTAKKEEADMLKGFQRGADDYMTKPFSLPELLARTKAILRRTEKSDDLLSEFKFGDILIDFNSMTATRDGSKLELTPREFKIMRLFCEKDGQVISRFELLDKVWGYDHYPTTRTVDNHMVKLRKAIEEDPTAPRYITSVRGVGYRFTSQPD